MTTMLIISIVKSSLALSLGLVGALSIIRFRAAIKEPEELAYLFLAIGISIVIILLFDNLESSIPFPRALVEPPKNGPSS